MFSSVSLNVNICVKTTAQQSTRPKYNNNYELKSIAGLGCNPKNKINRFLWSLFASPKSNQKGAHECQIRPDSTHKPTAPGAESVGFHTIRGHPPHLSHSVRFYWFKIKHKRHSSMSVERCLKDSMWPSRILLNNQWVGLCNGHC